MGSSGRVISPTQRPLPDNTQHLQETVTHPAGFETAIPASERPKTHALDRMATGTGRVRIMGNLNTLYKKMHRFLSPARIRLRFKCDSTRAETRFRLSAKRTSPFKSAGASVQSTTGSRGVRISGSNAGYTTFRDSVKDTGYPLHS
jgi:hypothetical protein